MKIRIATRDLTPKDGREIKMEYGYFIWVLDTNLEADKLAAPTVQEDGNLYLNILVGLDENKNPKYGYVVPVGYFQILE